MARQEYIAWQVSPSRQRHEWMRRRRAIIAVRIRVALIGHALFFLICGGLKLIGALPGGLFSIGCGSLGFASAGLFLYEWMHVKLMPRTPPVFVLRDNGLTEYSADGPRAHWDWERTTQLSIETDRGRPAYRSLVLAMNEPLLRKHFNFYFPLPDEKSSDVDEHQIVAALSEALEANQFKWKARADGAIVIEKYGI